MSFISHEKLTDLQFMNESHEIRASYESKTNSASSCRLPFLAFEQKRLPGEQYLEAEVFLQQTEWVQMLAISRAGPWQPTRGEAGARMALKSREAEGKLPLSIRHLQAARLYLTPLCRWAGPSGGGGQTLAINHCINLAQRENPRLAIIWS